MLKCMDVLRTVSYSEKDLIRIVVELVNDLRDSGNEDDGGEEPVRRLDTFADSPDLTISLTGGSGRQF